MSDSQKGDWTSFPTENSQTEQLASWVAHMRDVTGAHTLDWERGKWGWDREKAIDLTSA